MRPVGPYATWTAVLLALFADLPELTRAGVLDHGRADRLVKTNNFTHFKLRPQR